jgi:hypothetical protein
MNPNANVVFPWMNQITDMIKYQITPEREREVRHHVMAHR